MKRTMVYLPDELSKNLKRLAVERETSLAELIREATLALIEEDRGDLRAGRKALAEFRRRPASALDLDTYHRRRTRR